MYISWGAKRIMQTRKYLERGIEPANAIGYQGEIGRFMRVDQSCDATDFGVVRLSGIASGPLFMDFTRNFRKRFSVQYQDIESLLSDGWVVA